MLNSLYSTVPSLVAIATIPYRQRRQPLLGRDGILIDNLDGRDTIVTIGARPRQLAADLHLPLHVEGGD